MVRIYNFKSRVLCPIHKTYHPRFPGVQKSPKGVLTDKSSFKTSVNDGMDMGREPPIKAELPISKNKLIEAFERELKRSNYTEGHYTLKKNLLLINKILSTISKDFVSREDVEKKIDEKIIEESKYLKKKKDISRYPELMHNQIREMVVCTLCMGEGECVHKPRIEFLEELKNSLKELR